jgi:hypothetical protein
MKVFVLKRLVKDGEAFCDVWVAKTEEEVKKKAVEAVMADWFFAFGNHNAEVDENGDDLKAYDNDEIMDTYIDYWKDEEQWDLVEDEL